MTDRISIPIKKVGTVSWGALAMLAEAHEICGEKVDCINDKFSFAGGHRVRLYKFKKNVYWKIPVGVTLDISAVQSATPPQRRRHHTR